MPVNFTVNTDDLAYILKQIQVAERFTAGETLQSIIGQDFAILPTGLRAVDGTNNNLMPGGVKFGAADTLFPRLLPPEYIANTQTGPFGPVTNTNYGQPGSVVDSAPRIISNLISDMTNTNPAAIQAWFDNPLAIAAYQDAHGGALPLASYIPTNAELSIIPNLSPDIGLSPGFNGWMTFFGQFFDHGLDLVTKGGNGAVFIPLHADDPLIAGNDHILLDNPNTAVDESADNLPESLRFMALSRATPAVDPVTGQPTATNTTTGWIDQNQTYTSHPSHQVFLREYKFSADSNNDGTMDSHALSTGALLDGKNPDGSSNRSIANWGEVKAQALTMLGLTLTDKDVFNVPLLATDAYGEFIRGPNGFAQLVMPADATHAAQWLLEGTAGGLAIPPAALRTGHAFLDDIAATAAPKGALVADANTTVDDHLTGVSPGFYDDELLAKHFVTGDGRGNENIGLTAVHTVFHAEHNRLVAANKATIIAGGDLAVLNSWLLTPLAELPTTPAGIAALNWDGERMFQAAKFVTEMQYQHLVFEEFARKVQPNVDPFVFTNSPDLDPSIVAEFAHVVYRFGHSMLTETVSRLDVNLNANDVGLIEAFLNPLQFTASGATVEAQTGAIIRGMTRQLGNEIDEFVTEAVRNNLLGLPLDLPALNLARAREQGVPSFNHAREQFYAATSDAALKPYESWSDFVQNIKNPLSIVNFIAAYGTHQSVAMATTLVAKRDAAMLLVLGNFDLDGNGTLSANEMAPADRIDFLNHTGAWAATETGLNNVDFWIGGLAESKMEFGGMLGTTFNYVFETQMEKLQNGDRFYYLSRLQGLNLLNELEPNTFSALVMRNTDLGDVHSTHLPGSLFNTVDYTLELDPSVKQFTGLGTDGTADPTNSNAVLQALKPTVVRVAPGADTDGDGHADGGFLRFTGGEHVVLGGTEGNDTLIGDRGIDTLWGDGGNDRLNAGSESDQVFGGDGDDIITDPFGDDFLRGDEGNDVISSGPGLDILFGGGGNDFITGSTDTKEVFAGRGDDFVLGGSAADTLMGNEGDDWIEGGEGFDGLSGENSQLFFNSTIVGHDVLDGQGNDTDYDGENGDDIMVQGPGIQRNNGMDGFDWAIHKGDPNGADSDLGIRVFDARPALILRDRFDSVEGLSGWKGNDILTGAAKLLIGEVFDNRLTQAGLDRIAGLRDLLGIPNGPPGEIVFDPLIGGEIILGGAGSDLITGNLGDDVIDGDAWLNVRIAVHQNKDGTGPVLFSVDSLNEIKVRLLSGAINPGQLQIVREIVTTGVSAADVDTAAFSGLRGTYSISGNADGNVVVDHTGFVAVGGLASSNGRDTVSNIEALRFADVTVAVLNGTSGADTIVGTAGADIMVGRGGDDTYTVNNAGDLVIEGVNRGTDTVLSSLTSYQTEANVENVTVTNIDAARNAALVIAVGGNGLANVLTGHDRVGTVGGRDALNGNGGNDTLSGLGGVDRLTGGAGDDQIDGGTQADTAVFSGPVQNYRFDLVGTGMTVADRTRADGTDTLSGVENLEFNAQAFALAAGTNLANTLTGGGGADLVLGFGGNDTLNGGGGNDVLAGGAGDDVVNGGAGVDAVLWGVGDGRDVVDGGAGIDTVRISGDATAEAFHIYSRAAALTAGITGLNGASQIVITRTSGGATAVISELRNVEEIVITGNGGGDTFTPHGNFAGTGLSTSTITIEGSDGDDTVDISALTSAHRVVFTSTGGHDTVIGTLRPQDVIELAPGLSITDYAATVNANGTTTLTSARHSTTFATDGAPQFRGRSSHGSDESGHGSPDPQAPFKLTASDLTTLKALVLGLAVGTDGEDASGIRDLSGMNNNRAHPEYGAADQPYIRLTASHAGAFDPATGNRAINPIFDGLDPRAISNLLGAQEPGLPTNAKDASILFMTFGQYFDHGLDFLQKGGNGTIEIGGPGSGRAPGTDNPADLTRGTVAFIDAAGVPQHLNKTSPYVDQNQAYGSTALVGEFLRESDGARGYGAKLLAGGIDPSDPGFRLLPTLRELVQHHWDADTIFTAATLPGGAASFRAYYTGFALPDGTTGDLFGAGGIVNQKVLGAMVANFMGSGNSLLLDTNPFIGLLDHYVAGDGRANENVALTAMHTIWARNHNLHVDQLEAAGFVGTPAETFEAAKLVNEAEYQRVVFTEFADMLIGGIRGDGEHGHAGYNPAADARISHEFAAAVYRVGHSLIGQTLTVINAAGEGRQVSLFDAFLNPTSDADAFPHALPPGYVPQPGYEQLGAAAVLGGIAGQVAEEVDFNIVDAVRNDLVRINADLFSFNVARGRDVGLGTLNQVRMDLAKSADPYVTEAAGYAGDLTPYASWDDFQSRNNLSDTVIAQFKQSYPDLVLAADAIAAFQASNPDIMLTDGHIVRGIDRVDLWVGGLAEKHINDGMVGQTFWVVLHEQFDRLQEGDRLYYTDRVDHADFYRDFVKEQSLSDIIARNTSLQNLPRNSFEVSDHNAPIVIGAPGVVLPDANTAPVAMDDHLMLLARHTAAGLLLANDADANPGDILHVTAVQDDRGHSYAVPTVGALTLDRGHGSLTVSADGSYTYDAGNHGGSRSYSYTVSDGHGHSATARLQVDVQATPPAHSGGPMSFDYKLVDATVEHRNGSTWLMGPDGTATEVTGVTALTFSDGAVQAKDGSPLVDDLFYYAHNHDVWQAQVDPDTHYAEFGWREGRDPNALFSTRDYLAANPDVAAAGVNPMQHYAEFGWHEGRSPGGNFSAGAYLAANPDVAAAGVDPIEHYFEFGQAEGRSAMPEAPGHHGIGSATGTFGFKFIEARVEVVGGHDMLTAPNGTVTDVTGLTTLAFSDGTIQMDVASRLVDDLFYFAKNPDVWQAKVDPDTHYAEFGWREGRDPNGLFSTRGYLDANPDVAAADVNPLQHYDQYGWREGRDAGAEFTTGAYLAANPDVAAAEVDPLQHYLQFGNAEGRHH